MDDLHKYLLREESLLRDLQRWLAMPLEHRWISASVIVLTPRSNTLVYLPGHSQAIGGGSLR